MQNIGEVIKQKRTEKGLTQSQLAELLNVTTKTVSRWEKGQFTPETVYLIPLAKALDIDVKILVGETESTEEATVYSEAAQVGESISKEKKKRIFISLIMLAVLVAFVILVIHPYKEKVEYGDMTFTLPYNVAQKARTDRGVIYYESKSPNAKSAEVAFYTFPDEDFKEIQKDNEYRPRITHPFEAVYYHDSADGSVYKLFIRAMGTHVVYEFTLRDFNGSEVVSLIESIKFSSQTETGINYVIGVIKEWLLVLVLRAATTIAVTEVLFLMIRNNSRAKLMCLIFLILFFLLFPDRRVYKDGGTTQYWAPLYTVIKWKPMDGSRTGTDIYFFPQNFRNISDLEESH